MGIPIPNLNQTKVQFVAGAAVASLKLESDWTRTCGIAPDVNSALVPARDFDQLGDVTTLVGRIEFYFSPVDNQGLLKPDVTLAEIKIVDVQPSKYAVLPGKTKPEIVEYRVSFADQRERFIYPRGGHLTVGEVNKRPLKSSLSGTDYSNLKRVLQDANGHDILNPKQLVQICLNAMGLSYITAPTALSDMPPIFDLEWRGSHAPTELEKLLKAAGFAMHVTAAGLIKLVKIGDGETPAPVAGRLIADLAFQSIDRRGKACIITSAPNPILETKVYKGIQGTNSASTGGDWQYVILDKLESTDPQQPLETLSKWKPLTETAFYKTADPIDSVKKGFQDIPELYRQAVHAAIFRCIRLDPAKNGPAPIVRYTTVGGAFVRLIVSIKAKIAIQKTADGFYDNSDDLVNCNVTNILDDGEGHSVVVADQRLLQVERSALVLGDAPKLLGNDDLEVRLTRELYQQGADGRWTPQYYYAGFEQGFGDLKQLDVDGVNNLLATADATIVHRPDLRLIREDGRDVNRADLDVIAAEAAKPYVKGSGDPARDVHATGYYNGDLSGVVSKIVYSQERLMTTFHVNTFFTPSGEYWPAVTPIAAGDGGGGGGAAAEKYPGQQQAASERSSGGESGATIPAVPVLPPAPTAIPKNAVKVKITGPTSGRGSYFGVITTGNSTADPAKAVNEPDGQVNQGNTVIVRNLREDVSVILGSGPDHMLKPGEYLGLLVGAGTNGVIVDVESSRCGNSNIANLSHIGDTSTAAFTDSAPEGADRQEVNVSLLTRCVYSSGDDAFYEFTRVFSFQCGLLTAVSTETRTTVFSTGDCNPP